MNKYTTAVAKKRLTKKHVSMNPTIAQQQLETTIMGSGVFYAVHAEIL
jgi:hypothetical protein